MKKNAIIKLDLTEREQKVLDTFKSITTKKGNCTVTDIAKRLKRNSETIRSQMQSLYAKKWLNFYSDIKEYTLN